MKCPIVDLQEALSTTGAEKLQTGLRQGCHPTGQAMAVGRTSAARRTGTAYRHSRSRQIANANPLYRLRQRRSQVAQWCQGIAARERHHADGGRRTTGRGGAKAAGRRRKSGARAHPQDHQEGRQGSAVSARRRPRHAGAGRQRYRRSRTHHPRSNHRVHGRQDGQSQDHRGSQSIGAAEGFRRDDTNIAISTITHPAKNAGTKGHRPLHRLSSVHRRRTHRARLRRGGRGGRRRHEDSDRSRAVHQSPRTIRTQDADTRLSRRDNRRRSRPRDA